MDLDACHIYKIMLPRDGRQSPDPTRYLILYTPHHNLENAEVCVSVCSRGFCLALLIHSTSRAALTSTALHGTPAPFLGPLHVGDGTHAALPLSKHSGA